MSLLAATEILAARCVALASESAVKPGIDKGKAALA